MEINVSSNNQSGGITAGQVVGPGGSIAGGPKPEPPKPGFWKDVFKGTLSKLIAAAILGLLGAGYAYWKLKP